MNVGRLTVALLVGAGIWFGAPRPAGAGEPPTSSWIVSAPDSVGNSPAPRGAPAIGDTILGDVVAVYKDALGLFAKPASFSARDWAVAGGVFALEAATIPLDNPVRDAVRGDSNATLDGLTAVGNGYGTPLIGGAIAGTIWAAGLVANEPSIRVAGRHAAEAAIYSGLITTLAKWLIGRERPDVNGDHLVFVGPQSSDSHYSLPSGHTTLAFALSSSLASDIDNPIATVALYSAAALTGYSRIYHDRHWVSDVGLGAIIGTACGWGVATLDDAEPESHSSLRVVPGIDRLTLVVQW